MLRVAKLKRTLSLTDVVKIFFVTIVVSVLLTTCTLLSFSTHTNNQSIQTQNCAAECSSHGTASSLKTHELSDEEKDKEPIPPPAYWPLTAINIEATYLGPVTSISLIGLLAFLYKRRLLSTQLRI